MLSLGEYSDSSPATGIYYKKQPLEIDQIAVTNYGWILSHYTTDMFSDLIPMNSATSFTVETEIFCYDPLCSFRLFFRGIV
jgi:hypothetical protein